jgi:membrane protein implicated in regulation of membrane protease activity
MVAILLAVAVLGLRASGTFSHAPHQAVAGFTGTVLATTLSAAVGVAFIAVITVLAMTRPRRRPRRAEDPPKLRIPWWLKTLGVVASAFAVAAPLAILVARKTGHRTPTPFLLHPGVAAGAPGQPTGTSPNAGWSLVAGVVFAAAVVLTLALRSARNKRLSSPRQRGGLPETLSAARAALETGRTPREASIACYAAMERGFAAAGSAPVAADTPAEVLSRATRAGITRSASAEVLTGLFRRARYSDEPMTGADSAAAAGALAQMQAELRDLS